MNELLSCIRKPFVPISIPPHFAFPQATVSPNSSFNKTQRPSTKTATMYSIFPFALILIPRSMSFPFMVGIPNVRSAPEVESLHSKRQGTCPSNTNHQDGSPITAQFPYAGAKNGLPSTNPGNFQVPANGDTAHQFVPPGPNDIRGPCPGLNTAANLNVCYSEVLLDHHLLLNSNLVYCARWHYKLQRAS